MLNNIVLIGRLTRDPELRTTKDGTSVTSFTLAVNRPFSKDGKNEADFVPVVVWRKAAESCAKYLVKGSLAAAAGRLQIRSYEDKEGTKRTVAEVVADSVRFLDKKNGSAPSVSPEIENIFDDDDVPF